MAVFKPRERLVYFRISEDEFRQFSSVCEQGGARSVSDLARNAVQRLIAEGQRQREGQELEEKMRVLENLIAAVTQQLQLLTTSQVRESAPGADGFHAGAGPAFVGQTAGREEYMRFLSSGPDDPNPDQDLVPIENSLSPDIPRQPYVLLSPTGEFAENTINPGRLLRKYWMLLAALVILGVSAGFFSVVVTAPRYRGRLLMEVQSSTGSLTKFGAEGNGGGDQNYEVTIETQIGILNSGSFLKRGADRMQSETTPLVPHRAGYLLAVAAAHSARHSRRGGGRPDGAQCRDVDLHRAARQQDQTHRADLRIHQPGRSRAVLERHGC